MVASRRPKVPQRRNAFALDAQPSDQELLSSFLRERVSSGAGSDKNSSCGGFIHEADVYSAHPAELTRRHGAALASNGEEAWYFFSAVRAKGSGRRARTVDSGEGCWHSEAGSKPVVSAHLRGGGGGGLLGHRQNFSFVTKEDGVRVRSGWLMVELGLHGDGQDEVTICKVYFSPRTAAKNQRKKPALSSSSSSSATRKRKVAETTTPAPAGQRRRHGTPEAAAASSGSEMVVDDPVVAVAPPGEPEKASTADDEPGGVVGALKRFLVSLREERGIIVEEDYDRPPENVIVQDPSLPSSFTELLLNGPDDEDEWPTVVDSIPDPDVVVRRDRAQEPVIMFLTFDEMYALPQ
ncbi:hypothetical protein BRADI_2g46020v3, partial [Brachypodium distachyon]